ncbi:MAG: alkyl hydroperoxide reductase subunit C [Faecalispora jeddahensis]
MTNLIGRELPDFKLQAYHQGELKEISREDLEGQWSILFFYPADFSFVCPTELGDLADHYSDFKKIGVEVYSVSTDSQYVHKAWADASDTIKKIQYPMLADRAGALSKELGIYVESDGLALRGTFIVNPQGKIVAYEVNDLGIGRNAEEVLRKVQAAQFVDKHGDQVCPAKWKPGEETLSPSLNLVGKL